MARARIAVFVLALLVAEWPGAARAARHLAVKRGRPVSLDPEPAVRLVMHSLLVPRELRSCHGVASSVLRLCSLTSRL